MRIPDKQMQLWLSLGVALTLAALVLWLDLQEAAPDESNRQPPYRSAPMWPSVHANEAKQEVLLPGRRLAIFASSHTDGRAVGYLSPTAVQYGRLYRETQQSLSMNWERYADATFLAHPTWLIRLHM
jgi:hypothetical protein